MQCATIDVEAICLNEDSMPPCFYDDILHGYYIANVIDFTPGDFTLNELATFRTWAKARQCNRCTGVNRNFLLRDRDARFSGSLGISTESLGIPQEFRRWRAAGGGTGARGFPDP